MKGIQSCGGECMDKCLYVEICAILAMIMALIICNVKRQYTLVFGDKLFLAILWTATGIFLCDGIWVLMDGLTFQGAAHIDIFLNIIFFTLTGIIGFLWLVYTDYKIYDDEERLREKMKWYILPLGLLWVMTFISPWTGWIFPLSADGVKHRGRYHVIQMIISYGYLAWSAYQAIMAYQKTDQKYLKTEYRTMSHFIIFPILGGILQRFVFGYPLIWVGTALSILMIFLKKQNQQITKDGLTGVNNRRYLNQYLDTKICNRHRKKKLFFVLMDIDSFKQINDTFGHIEGDAAIIRVAGILKGVCCNNNDFLARYGGDEFAIVCEREDCQEIENLLHEINAIISFSNEAGDKEYDMWLSIGYAELGECTKKDQDQLIDLADQRLYEAKKRKR